MSSRLLLFDCGRRVFALDFAVVGEVLDASGEVFPVPFTPSWLASAIAYKGSVVPVLDLAEYHAEEHGALTGYVVLDPAAAHLALRVEGPIRVVPCKSQDEISGGDDLSECTIQLPGGTAELLVAETLALKLEELLRRHGQG